MPKSKKSTKNSKNLRKKENVKRKIVYADDMGQVYGVVEKKLGGKAFEVLCSDGKTRRCYVRSKRMRIHLQQCVIISLREFLTKDNTGDIIHTYTPDEKNHLLKIGKLGELKQNEEDEVGIVFENEFEDLDFDDI